MAQSNNPKPLYPVEVIVPAGPEQYEWREVADRESHRAVLRAWGCESNIFLAVTREEAKRIAAEELAEIAERTERGHVLLLSWIRFENAMNHQGGIETNAGEVFGPRQGFFFAGRGAATIGGNWQNDGTETLREWLTRTLTAEAGFTLQEVERMRREPTAAAVKECINARAKREGCELPPKIEERLARIEEQGSETRGLVGEIRVEQKTRKERQQAAGKMAANADPAIVNARAEAKRDLEAACMKVHRLVAKGWKQEAACAEVCEHFRELTESRKGGAEYAPLLSARLDAKGSRTEMKPTALTRRYSEWCKKNGLPSPREQVKQAKAKLKKRGQ